MRIFFTFSVRIITKGKNAIIYINSPIEGVNSVHDILF